MYKMYIYYRLTTLLDVPRTVEFLAYLGYQYLHDSQVSAIQGMSYLGYQYVHDSQVSAIQGVS